MARTDRYAFAVLIDPVGYFDAASTRAHLSLAARPAKRQIWKVLNLRGKWWKRRRCAGHFRL